MSRQEDFIEAGIAYRMEHSKPMCIAGSNLADVERDLNRVKPFEAGAEYGYQYAQTHPNWISVKDKLPPENGKTQQSISVWATNGLMPGEFRYNFDTKTWTDMWGNPFDITHWMPLPQPPRKDGGEL